MLRQVRSWWVGRQILQKIGRQSLSSLWPSISHLWGSADCLFAGPVGPGALIAPEYSVLKDMLSAHREEASQLLRSGLSDSRPYVVAYCIYGLGLIEQIVQPSEFGHRTDQVRWRLASRTGQSRLTEISELTAPPGEGPLRDR